MLFLDDLQWADDATLELVTYLARRPQPGSPLLLLARRDEETSSGEHAAALHANAEALALPGRYGEAARATRLRWHRATPRARSSASSATSTTRLGEWEPAERHFSAAAANGGHDAERSQLHSDWSLTALHRGDGDRALALAREALALADAAGEPGALAQAHNMLGLLALSRGDTDEAPAAHQRSLELAERARDTTARVAALNNWRGHTSRPAGWRRRWRADPAGARPVCRAGRSPPRGRPPQQPRRPPAGRRPLGGGRVARAEGSGSSRRWGPTRDCARPEIWKLRRW